jgi:hypothetical protein
LLAGEDASFGAFVLYILDFGGENWLVTIDGALLQGAHIAEFVEQI